MCAIGVVSMVFTGDLRVAAAILTIADRLEKQVHYDDDKMLYWIVTGRCGVMMVAELDENTCNCQVAYFSLCAHGHCCNSFIARFCPTSCLQR